MSGRRHPGKGGRAAAVAERRAEPRVMATSMATAAAAAAAAFLGLGLLIYAALQAVSTARRLSDALLG
jgi:hypothetical protein